MAEYLSPAFNVRVKLSSLSTLRQGRFSMSHEIFISYRRKDTGGYAGRLYENLIAKFGRDGVLFDVAVEGTAELLRDWVSRVIPEVAVELVLIGEEWLIDRHGRRRLGDEGDIV